MLEQGEITDSTGRKISLRHAIIILTTSYGAQESRRGAVGFGNDAVEAEREGFLRDRLKDFFTPELLNRIDKVCLFSALKNEHLLHVAALELKDINERLVKYHTSLTPDTTALAWLVDRAGKQSGARDVRRMVREYVEKLLVTVVTKRSVRASYRLSVKDDSVVVK